MIFFQLFFSDVVLAITTFGLVKMIAHNGGINSKFMDMVFPFFAFSMIALPFLAIISIWAL